MSRKRGSMLATAARSVLLKAFELPPPFEPFVRQVPCEVMARLILQWLMDETMLQDLFDQVALAPAIRDSGTNLQNDRRRKKNCELPLDQKGGRREALSHPWPPVLVL